MLDEGDRSSFAAWRKTSGLLLEGLDLAIFIVFVNRSQRAIRVAAFPGAQRKGKLSDSMWLLCVLAMSEHRELSLHSTAIAESMKVAVRLPVGYQAVPFKEAVGHGICGLFKYFLRYFNIPFHELLRCYRNHTLGENISSGTAGDWTPLTPGL